MDELVISAKCKLPANPINSSGSVKQLIAKGFYQIADKKQTSTFFILETQIYCYSVTFIFLSPKIIYLKLQFQACISIQ